MSETVPEQSVAYPPEPWHLAGSGQITVWRVPAGQLPGLPAGVRPLTVRGRALVATAFVSYSDAGQMAYDELLAAVVVRHGRGVALSITDIWVDSPASRAGGRALWGIPKEMATFRAAAGPAGSTALVRAATPGVMSAGGAQSPSGAEPPSGVDSPSGAGSPAAAEAEFAPRRLRAVPLPALPGSVVQTLEGATVASRSRASGRVRPARATWTFAADGPLGWLRGARPLTSVVADEFAMSFGPRLG